MKVSVNLKARYFNQNAFGHEYLIEPCDIYFRKEQEEPLTLAKTMIDVNSMLNINLTYCSLYSMAELLKQIIKIDKDKGVVKVSKLSRKLAASRESREDEEKPEKQKKNYV